MKIKSLTLLMVLSCVLFVNGQNYKPGKVSKEELKQTQDPLFPDADAAILYREYIVKYDYSQSKGFELSTTVFERIKIYNPEGFDWGTKRIKTYNYNADREQVGGIKAVTYNLVDGSIEKDKLKTAQIFEERINNYYVATTFTMPNLKAGSVIEVEYILESPFSSIDDIDLQYTIPVKKIVVDVKVPDFFVYKQYPNPQAALAYTFAESDKNIELKFREQSGLGTLNRNGNIGSSDGRQLKDRTASYQERRYLLEEVNIPPLKNQGYVDNIRNYQARSIWELSLIKNPNGIPKNYSTSWEAVTKSIYENDKFVNQLNKEDYYKDELSALLSGVSDPMEKMAIIYNFVQKKVSWNGSYGYFPENGVKQAYKAGQGNVGDINIMLTSMLQSQNIPATPVLVSVKNYGVPLFPTRYGFNYLVVKANVSGKSFLMDATDPYSYIGLLPERAMNWQGRAINRDGTSNWVPLYPSFASNALTYVQAEIKDGAFEIKTRERLSQHYARDYRSEFRAKSNESQMSSLDKNGEDVSFSEFDVKDLDTNKEHLTRSFKATSPSLIEEINGDLYFSPMLIFAQKENPLKDDNRLYPLFFDYPKSRKYNITIKIPEGYKVNSLPEQSKAQLAGGAAEYSYLISEAGSNLQLAVTLDINNPIFVADDYQYVKAMFSQIVEKETEKVVLSKI
ncbi:DUF3857 domain-containing protein [Patiriisocius marinus]|uniref:DUF3857 domain-containing protein n=1 Tax=Patiriisocius marinus TaxID=1397112 RepID=UPI00232FD46D|nr:DUF3857 domain-containing protein [Patiriisocius marinus]